MHAEQMSQQKSAEDFEALGEDDNEDQDESSSESSEGKYFNNRNFF